MLNAQIVFAESLPAFALPDDSVVEIQGDPSGLQKAVESIGTQLRKYLVDRSVIGVFEMQASWNFRICGVQHLLLFINGKFSFV